MMRKLKNEGCRKGVISERNVFFVGGDRGMRGGSWKNLNLNANGTNVGKEVLQERGFFVDDKKSFDGEN